MPSVDGRGFVVLLFGQAAFEQWNDCHTVCHFARFRDEAQTAYQGADGVEYGYVSVVRPLATKFLKGCES